MSTDTEFPYRKKPEIWGGIECTINRVENVYRDQLQYSGHYYRKNDIERFAELGVSKLRYPVLWEKHQPKKYGSINWEWIENQLNTIRENNIIPIAGLLHHGSGPSFTDLLDKDFGTHLAAYASQVASQFPWLEYYTPVNEPLTTARFSGLYGLWYPHHKNELSFVRMLLHQVKAIVLSMQAIRIINPAAKLVQTEDLSKTHSTAQLAYQAAFENERRWLTYDLLCGKVNREHFFWNYFTALGIKETDLEFFLESNCPPEIMGFNYYVTSERWLDEQLDKYPMHTHGGNARDAYADTEAVRAIQISGPGPLLSEAWQRYKLPLAITECHLNCTREEQLRWLKETWDTCCTLQNEGADVRAITAWSLLGAYDWNSVLTQCNHHYESGVFDLRSKNLRPTSLAKLIRSLAIDKEYEHPLLSEKGWWSRQQNSDLDLTRASDIQKSPLLITGRNGTLGQAFIRICERRFIPYVALSRVELDITKEEDIRLAIEKYKPWAVVNAAGYVRVDEAELHQDECFAINATGPVLLAKCCNEYGIRFMSFSSDLVFDGQKKKPYHEADDVLPLNVYGASKAQGEKGTLAHCPDSLVIRTSAFFGPWDKYNFVHAVLEALEQQKPFYTALDVMVSPTYVPDLADTAMDLFIDEEKGIWHLCNDGMLTWAEFGAAIADRSKHEQNTLVAKSLIEMGWKAKRPLYSVLESGKGIKMPSFDSALDRYFEQRAV